MFVARVKRQSDESQEEKKFSRDGEKSAKSIRHVESTPQMQRLSRESINLNQSEYGPFISFLIRKLICEFFLSFSVCHFQARNIQNFYVFLTIPIILFLLYD